MSATGAPCRAGSPGRGATRRNGHLESVLSAPQRALPFRPGDLVLLEEELDAARVLSHDIVLPLQHRRQIQRQRVVGDRYSVLRRMLPRKLVMLRAREKRLRWNAADVDTRAAKRPVHLDANRVQAELTCADGGDVTARPTADDDYIGRS